MTSAATLAAAILAEKTLSDERFFQATALLATRFDRHSEFGDLRSDDAAPQLLMNWFAHARLRVPDMRVWDLTCQINHYFDPDFGLYLPHDWPWDVRDSSLWLSEHLRDRPEWVPVFERTLMLPDSDSVRALACCAAEQLGVDPYPMLWAYLSEHVDEGCIWHLIKPMIHEGRLAAYLGLARMTLLGERDRECELSGRTQRREGLWFVWRQVLELLQKYPGEGIDLIERALRSQDSGLRGHAVDVLSMHWGGRGIPTDTLNLVSELALTEVDVMVQRRLDWLLSSA